MSCHHVFHLPQTGDNLGCISLETKTHKPHVFSHLGWHLENLEISGDPEALPAAGHPAAPVAYMVSDMYSPGAVLDYPKGGMGAAQTRRDMMRHAGNPGPGENKLCLEALGHEFGDLG